jgi:hypothetical protein
MDVLVTPTEELINFLLAGRVRRGGNLVLGWMASNAAVRAGGAGNLTRSRRRIAEGIDRIVALINERGRNVRARLADQSVYVSRGLLAR